MHEDAGRVVEWLEREFGHRIMDGKYKLELGYFVLFCFFVGCSLQMIVSKVVIRGQLHLCICSGSVLFAWASGAGTGRNSWPHAYLPCS